MYYNRNTSAIVGIRVLVYLYFHFSFEKEKHKNTWKKKLLENSVNNLSEHVFTVMFYTKTHRGRDEKQFGRLKSCRDKKFTILKRNR